MKNKTLIKKLQKFPLDMKVCILDVNENTRHAHADEDGVSEGVYFEFGVNQPYSKRELKEMEKEHPGIKNMIMLEFVDDTDPNKLYDKTRSDDEVEGLLQKEEENLQKLKKYRRTKMRDFYIEMTIAKIDTLKWVLGHKIPEPNKKGISR